MLPVEILVCPRCRSPLSRDGTFSLQCPSLDCELAGAPFPVVGGQAVLIDFDDSILDRDHLLASSGASVLARGSRLRIALARFINGANTVTPYYAKDMIARLTAGGISGRRPRILIIGGGSIGNGSDELYGRADVDCVGIDIYASAHTALVADAHALPFADGAFDGVWIQAVLEHVLEPWRVAEEIHRVLGPGGLIFADTPFLWPIHEGAYDFTRFTNSGHRWLFKKFAHIASGYSSGSGVSLLLAIRYALFSLFRSGPVATLLILPLFWLRYLDRLGSRMGNLTSAGGVFFYGSRLNAPIHQSEMLDFYKSQSAPAPHGR